MPEACVRPSIAAILEASRDLCTAALSGPELSGAGRALEQAGITVQQAAALVKHAGRERNFPASVQAALEVAREEANGGSHFVERYLILQAGLRSLERLPATPVCDSVKRLICRELQYLAEPAPEWLHQLRPGTSSFRTYCAIASLEWFPAGPFTWTESGLPRSCLVRLRWRELPKVLLYLAFELKGSHPLLVPHLSVMRTTKPIILEREYNRFYFRVARSLELQPHVKGVFAASWMFSAETFRVTPHLAFLAHLITANGGIAADMGPAPADGGFLAGSMERKRLYESGEFKPRQALLLWSRRAILAWAGAHPEYRDDMD